MEPGITLCRIIEQLRGQEDSSNSLSPSSSNEIVEDDVSFSPVEELKTAQVNEITTPPKLDESTKGDNNSSLKVLSYEKDVFEIGNIDDFPIIEPSDCFETFDFSFDF
jgi:hypothetical protein